MFASSSASYGPFGSLSIANRRAVLGRALWRTTLESSRRPSRTRNLKVFCGKSQDELISEVYETLETEYNEKIGDKGDVGEVYLSTLPDRGQFVDDTLKPYEDAEVEIYQKELRKGPEEFLLRVTKPSLQIFMLRKLQPYISIQKPARVLDVGVGSGYSTACLFHLVGSNGTVWGVDNNNSVIKYAEERLKKLYEKEMLSQRLTLTPADVLGETGEVPQTDLPKAYSNFKKHGNFDAIHVGAAVRFPEEVVMLLDLLKPGGAMVVPQYENEGQSDSQVLVKYTKSMRGITRGEFLTNVKFDLLSPEDGDYWDEYVIRGIGTAEKPGTRPRIIPTGPLAAKKTS